MLELLLLMSENPDLFGHCLWTHIRRGGATKLSVFQMWPTDVERESNLSLVSRGGKESKDVISMQEEVTPRLLSTKQKASVDKGEGV